jgi:hypothetical protein
MVLGRVVECEVERCTVSMFGRLECLVLSLKLKNLSSHYISENSIDTEILRDLCFLADPQ